MGIQDCKPFLGGDLYTYSTSRAGAFLTTPTYDGSGQVVHPSVYDAGAGGWNGHRYWMAGTPFPAADGTKELPSILVSDDKTTWSVPAGLTNPLISYQASHQPSDSELVMVGSNLYYLYVDATGGNNLVREMHSTDGITWTSPTTILTAGNAALVSPGVVWDGSQWVMYSVNAAATPKTLERRTCATLTGTWSGPVTCTCALPGGSFQWHVDVVLSGTYYAFLNLDQISLWLAKSTDGLMWTVQSVSLLASSAADIWDKNIYRSTAVKTATGFDLWYTGYSAASEWHIGYAAVIGS